MKKLQIVNEEKKKKLDNFWYYYKFHVLAGIFVLFCAGIFVKDTIGRVEYDYTIGFLGNYSITPEDSASLQKWFEENGEDLNGDGEVHVELADYPLAAEGDSGYNPQMIIASQTKFNMDVQEEVSMIFFLSEENYKDYKDMGIFPSDRAQLADVNACAGFQQAGKPVSVQDMIVSMRLFPADIKEDEMEEKQNYYEASEALLKKFIGE